MMILLGIVGVVALLFCLTVFFGAPYVPTLKADVEKSIELTGLHPGDTLVDLGSGDGRLLLAAAEKGLQAVGYEVNPLLVLISWWRCRAYRANVAIHMKDFRRAPLPDTTKAVFVFTAAPFIKQLNKHLRKEATRLGRPLILVSYGFAMPGLKPIQQDRAIMCYRIEP